MNNKLIPALVLVIVIIAVGGLLMMNKTQPANPAPSGDQKQVFDPKNPGFVMGQVTRVEEGKIEFQAGGNLLTAQISASTKLVKQAKDAKNLISNADATLADFKAKQIIVVYFSTPPVAQVYQADKVQIISQ